jgi:two-component system cell cycle response regulator DivK
MYSVLLVEPHDDTREMYGEFLRFHGFDVRPCDNTDTAWEIATTADVVVTGVHVEGAVDGRGFVRRLRDDPQTGGLPIIVLSASAFETDAERAAAAGCDLFLAKPCLPQDLVAAIRRVIRIRRAARRRMRKAATPRP